MMVNPNQDLDSKDYLIFNETCESYVKGETLC